MSRARANGIGIPALPKRKPFKRDWKSAHAKLESEPCCRNCGSPGPLDPAHVLPRSRIRHGGEAAANIIGLCRDCHRLADEGSGEVKLWLGPLLTEEELAYAVGLVGEGEAERRLFGRRAA